MTFQQKLCGPERSGMINLKWWKENTKNTLPSKAIIQISRRDKEVLQTSKSSNSWAQLNRLHRKCKRGFSKWKRKDHNWRYESYERKYLIGKSKYTVKVVDQPFIKLVGKQKKVVKWSIFISSKKDTESKKMWNIMLKYWMWGGIKCRLVIICSNLRDHQFKIAISSWKPQTINLSSIHTHKNKGMKQKGREQKQKARPKYTLPEETHFRSHSTQTESKETGKVVPCKWNQKEIWGSNTYIRKNWL